jgi:DnaJ like chaperone protein
MSSWGKILGGAAGLLLGGPFGALAGAVAGHAVDRYRDTQGDSQDAEPADATKSIGFTIAVIVLGAKMAKVDGVVTRGEIRAFREVFHVPPEEERNVARLFDQARRDAAGFEPYAHQVGRMLKDSPAVLEELLNCLFHIAKADGAAGTAELTYLRAVSDLFGLSETAFDRIRASHVGTDERDPYAVLGLQRSTTPDEIRQRYRALIREHHPDRLTAQGLPPEFVDVATRRMATINAAYDEIAKARGIT